ncbi:DUF2341 domain-containing protein [Paenibacillus flagellatus]|uniref:Uncharacterized protein n=1 Tax=Paenibacillus flagellatus TaxID=2211139 RepID=A0A2V5K3V3_9BACL|nr:DUF2341 domain-containing protein [Paenibacillus flagellatus]PYI53965.1 hypothetical protein DLM86_15545 [Paenibacillus flagellatus]
MRKLALLLIAAILGALFSAMPGGPVAHAAKWTGTVGYLNNDGSPATGALGSFGATGPAALDYFNRSVGIDLGAPRGFDEIRLLDADTTNRINDATDLSVYVSNDNVSYTQATGWSFSKAGHTITLGGLSATARYVKVRSNFADAGAADVWLSMPSLQQLIEVHQTPAVAALPGSVGYADNDRNPAASPLGNWGVTLGIALDYAYRSVGVDLGSVRPFNTVELIESQAPSRLQKPDLSLYVSNDNATYTKVADWDFLKLGRTIVLYNFNATARYVKIHNHIDDTSYTFSNTNQQRFVRVLDRPAGQWTASGGGAWAYRKPVQVTNGGASVLYDRSVYVAKSALGTAALVSAGKLQPDFRDIRFADASGKELPFYMDKDGFYVNIRELATGGSTIYAYYGNPSAAFVGAGQEALQVEYGNKTLTDHTSGSFRHNLKPVKLADGTLMMVANYGASSGILATYSSDGGRTWTAPTVVVNLNDAGRDEPGSLFVDPANGDVFLFFYSYYGYTTSNCLTAGNACRNDLYYAKSTDNGVTFGTPVRIDTGTLVYNGTTYPINYNITYSNPIQLANGDWVLPFHYVCKPDGAFAESVLYSTDRGATWTKSASQITVQSSGGEAGLTEASIVQLTNGTLKMYMRQQLATSYRLAESVSTDNGRTWSAPVDSPLFAPNTMSAMTRHTNGDILLLWPGNNAFGGTSYLRNPLSLAYSKDESATWSGMRDLLGRTRLSEPMVNPVKRVATQPDLVRVDADTYLFGWWGQSLTTAETLLVEDFNRYLYRSHGVADDFEYAELKNDYWWQVGATVETSTVRSKSGTASLRLLDDNTTSLTAGSRLFPSMKKGTVSFSLYAASLSNRFSFSLREPFSLVHSAPGTAFQFMLEPDGSLKAYNSSGSLIELPVPTDLTTGAWHDIEVRFDTDAKQATVFVNGANKGTVGHYLDANVVAHFHIASASTTGTGTDVYIDNLIIRDTGSGLPTAGTVGAEQPV